MLTVNGVEPTSINYNGTELTEVYAKQGNNTPVLVWASSFTYNWTGDMDTIPGIDSFRSSTNRENNYMDNRNVFHSSDTSDIGMVISRSFPYKITTSFELDCHVVSYSQMGYNRQGLNKIWYTFDWNAITSDYDIYILPRQHNQDWTLATPTVVLNPAYYTRLSGTLQTNYTIPFREDDSNLSLVQPRFEPGVTVYGQNLHDGQGGNYTPEINVSMILDGVSDSITIPIIYEGEYYVETDGDDYYYQTWLKCSLRLPNYATFQTKVNSTYTVRDETEVWFYIQKDGIENEINEGDTLGTMTATLQPWTSSQYQYIVWDRWRPIFSNGSTRWAGEWETGKPSYDTKTATVLN